MCPLCRSSILDGRGLKYELNYATMLCDATMLCVVHLSASR
jgi:hypothetical protein